MKKIASLKAIQERVDEWINSHGGYWPPLSMLASIMEEVGELSREINHLEGFKPKKESERPSDLGGELADLLFSIICVANHYDLDLTENFHGVLEKYTERDSKRFTSEP